MTTLQEKIIQELGVLPTIDPKEEVRKSIDFLKAYLTKHPFLKTFVLGISGGQDSTLAGRLAQLAMTEMREETGDMSYQFIAIRLPYGEQADEAVIGTDHAAENVTAFFTKYGDGGADILPLFRLNKRQGKALLKELGAPEALYLKIPTADLEDDKPLVADEVALGVTYDAIDDYLEGKKVSETDQQTIENWYKKGQHKRHLPITIFDDFWK